MNRREQTANLMNATLGPPIAICDLFCRSISKTAIPLLAIIEYLFDLERLRFQALFDNNEVLVEIQTRGLSPDLL